MAIHTSWTELEERRQRHNYEVARWTVFKTLCPPDKKSINIFDIEKFSWDPEDQAPEAPVSTKESYEKAKAKFDF